MSKQPDKSPLMCSERNCSAEPILARIEERLEGIETDLLDLTKRLIGNGNPGIILKVDRLEQKHATLSKFFWILVAAFVGFLFKSII